jgi:hypothetical protein
MLLQRRRDGAATQGAHCCLRFFKGRPRCYMGLAALLLMATAHNVATKACRGCYQLMYRRRRAGFSGEGRGQRSNDAGVHGGGFWNTSMEVASATPRRFSPVTALWSSPTTLLRDSPADHRQWRCRRERTDHQQWHCRCGQWESNEDDAVSSPLWGRSTQKITLCGKKHTR